MWVLEMGEMESRSWWLGTEDGIWEVVTRKWETEAGSGFGRMIGEGVGCVVIGRRGKKKSPELLRDFDIVLQKEKLFLLCSFLSGFLFRSSFLFRSCFFLSGFFCSCHFFRI